MGLLSRGWSHLRTAVAENTQGNFSSSQGMGLSGPAYAGSDIAGFKWSRHERLKTDRHRREGSMAFPCPGQSRERKLGSCVSGFLSKLWPLSNSILVPISSSKHSDSQVAHQVTRFGGDHKECGMYETDSPLTSSISVWWGHEKTGQGGWAHP